MRTHLKRPALLTFVLSIAVLMGFTGSLLSPTQAAQPAPPEKFVLPIGGEPFGDWSIVNYVDVDPTSGERDCFGGTRTGNDHKGIDITLAHFSLMDQGIPVYAAASGEVIEAHDGEFDRNHEARGQPANFIRIDHGQGWITLYTHLRRDSVLVDVGDQVEVGQKIAEVGSSGNSTAAHLHFGVFHNEWIATYCDPEKFWVDPLPYQDTVDTVMDAGTTNVDDADFDSITDQKERLPENDVFLPGEEVSFWAAVSVTSNSTVETPWFRPDGTEYTRFSWDVTDAACCWWVAVICCPGGEAGTHDEGEWEVAFVVDGVELARNTFIVSRTGKPEIRVDQGSQYIPDGRTTPIDFGTVPQGGSPTSQTFTVTNYGTESLTLGGVNLPPGFQLVEGLTSMLPAGESDDFSVRLDSSLSGEWTGDIAISSNDAEEPSYAFAVEGTVTSNQTSATFRVERSTGNVFTDGSLNPGGADLAERIKVSEPVEPGDVVAIDPQNHKHYRKTRRARSSLAAGVIASDPGMVLGVGPMARSRLPLLNLTLSTWISQTAAIDSSVNFSLAKLVPALNFTPFPTRPVLALMGRVPVKATTENGPIHPGDLLVSSSMPGHVMRCGDPGECEGAIVGRALTPLEGGTGRIEMLVMR